MENQPGLQVWGCTCKNLLPTSASSSSDEEESESSTLPSSRFTSPYLSFTAHKWNKITNHNISSSNPLPHPKLDYYHNQWTTNDIHLKKTADNIRNGYKKQTFLLSLLDPTAQSFSKCDPKFTCLCSVNRDDQNLPDRCLWQGKLITLALIAFNVWICNRSYSKYPEYWKQLNHHLISKCKVHDVVHFWYSSFARHFS